MVFCTVCFYVYDYMFTLYSVYWDYYIVLFRLVKVYVASTYTDMMLEKSVLFHEVYPLLKKYCM